MHLRVINAIASDRSTITVTVVGTRAWQILTQFFRSSTD